MVHRLQKHLPSAGISKTICSLEGGHIFLPITTGAESSEDDDFSLSSLDGENVNGRLTSATFPDSQKSISKSLKPLVLLIGNDGDEFH